MEQESPRTLLGEEVSVELLSARAEAMPGEASP